MPFGSVQSVYSFLRISHAIWYLGATQLLLPWTFFYDDFLCYSVSHLSAVTEGCASLLFELIGWRIAREGSKAEGFSEYFKCLGVAFDLRDSIRSIFPTLKIPILTHIVQMGWFNHQRASTLMPQPNVSRHLAVLP